MMASSEDPTIAARRSSSSSTGSSRVVMSVPRLKGHDPGPVRLEAGTLFPAREEEVAEGAVADRDVDGLLGAFVQLDRLTEVLLGTVRVALAQREAELPMRPRADRSIGVAEPSHRGPP